MVSLMLRRVVLVLMGGVVLAAQSHTFRSTWRAPDLQPLDFSGRKVAAVVISRDESLRMSGEEALAREINARGPEGVAAYRAIPREELEDPARARAWFERIGVAGVVTLQVVSVEKEKTYSSVAWTTSYYQSFSTYYRTGWETVTPIGGPREDTVVAVETMLYDVAEGKLLWAGVSEATNPERVRAFIEGLADAVVEELGRQGLLKRPPR
jgi:hypothetical protein